MDCIELWTEEVCDDPDCRWTQPKNHRHVPYPPSLTGTGIAGYRETKD